VGGPRERGIPGWLARPCTKVARALDAADRRMMGWCRRLAELAYAGLGRAWGRAGPHVLTVLSVLERTWRKAADRAGRAFSFLAERMPLSCFLGMAAACSAVLAGAIMRWGPRAVLVFVMGMLAEDTPALGRTAAPALVPAIVRLAEICSFLSALASLAAFVRTRLSLWILKAAASAFAVLTALTLYTAWAVPGQLSRADSTLFPSETRNEMLVQGTWRLAPAVAVCAIFLFLLILCATARFYGDERRAASPGLGDRIWENLRSHGRDPAYRKALYVSALLHFFVIVILPFMLVWWGCPMKPYGVPKGTGTPVLEMVRIKKIKIKQPKKYVLSLNTAISFYVPKIDDSQVFEEVDKLTENIYEVQKTQKGSGLGAGGPGPGGWPHGMDKVQVRFIRLEYDGGDWDQDMGYGADYNMLLKFREYTKFNIAPKTESIRIQQLMRFPKKRAPPFVYLTGGLRGSIGVSHAECKILRKYCIDMGGLIFADNGGGNFDQSFRALLKRTFPELPLVEIPYDDVIFQQPFYFPSGAPPLWHHSGNQAMGVKYNGRWIVFYHQGDINDAWKDGHSGASQNLAEQAYKLGVNVINYAFNQYMQINYGDR